MNFSSEKLDRTFIDFSDLDSVVLSNEGTTQNLLPHFVYASEFSLHFTRVVCILLAVKLVVRDTYMQILSFKTERKSSKSDGQLENFTNEP